jgi:hypothetical protein
LSIVVSSTSRLQESSPPNRVAGTTVTIINIDLEGAEHYIHSFTAFHRAFRKVSTSPQPPQPSAADAATDRTADATNRITIMKVKGAAHAQRRPMTATDRTCPMPACCRARSAVACLTEGTHSFLLHHRKYVPPVVYFRLLALLVLVVVVVPVAVLVQVRVLVLY